MRCSPIPPPVSNAGSSGPRENEACLECRSRKSKRKCIRSDVDATSCTRCLATETACIFSRAKPGRKRKQPSGLEQDAAPWSVSRLDLDTSPSAVSHDAVHVAEPGNLSSTPTRHAFRIDPASSDQTCPDSQPLPVPTQFSDPSARISGDRRLPYLASEGFSLRGVTNEASRRIVSDQSQWSPAQTVHRSPLNAPETDRSLAASLASPGEASRRSCPQLPKIDLVSLGVVPPEVAKDVLRYYFDHMNPVIAILDEHLHGYPQLLDRSSLLFSVILAVSARVCRPEIHMRAANAAANLLSLAFEKDACDIEFVQALSIMVFWRNVDDGSGWRKTGYAIRMAYELGLHSQRRSPLPLDLAESRELLNRERTWIQLCCADINFSLQCSLPAMIVHDGLTELGWWFREHAISHPCPSEGVLHPSLLLLRIVRSHAELLRLQSKAAEVGMLLDRVEARHEQWQADWIDEASLNCAALSAPQRAVVVFASRHLSFKIAEFRLELATTDHDIAFARVRDAVLGVISAFLNLGQLDMLPYCQDMVFIGLVTCVIWLCNRVGPSTTSDVQLLQSRILAVIQAIDNVQTGAIDIAGRTSRLLRAVCRVGDAQIQGGLSQRSSIFGCLASDGSSSGAIIQEADFTNFLESQLVPQDLDFWSNWLQA